MHCTEEESSWKNIHSLLDTQAEHIEVGLLLKATFMEVFIPLILQLTKIKIKTVAAKLLTTASSCTPVKTAECLVTRTVARTWLIITRILPALLPNCWRSDVINSLVTFGSNNHSCLPHFYTTSASRIKSKTNSLANWQEQGNWDKSEEAGAREWNMVTTWQGETNSKMAWDGWTRRSTQLSITVLCSLTGTRQQLIQG